MKQKDIATLLVVAIISAVISFFVATQVFNSTGKRQQEVPTVDAINSQFILPSTKYFNNQSIDPAQEVEIGDSNNQNPFTAANQ